jgi:hypothetical protein
VIKPLQEATEQANKLEIQISKYNAYSEYYTKLATQLLEGSGLLNEDAQKLFSTLKFCGRVWILRRE